MTCEEYLATRPELAERLRNRTHGKDSTYVAGCRGDACRQARQEYMRRYKQQVADRGFTGLTHGTDSTYLLGCPCTPCREAHLLAGADYRRRTKAGTQ